MKILLILWALMIGISLTVSINPVNATTVTVTAEIASSQEQGPSPGIFKFIRTGDLTQPLTVNFTLSGSAVKEADYLIWENSAQFDAMNDTTFVAILPVNDALDENDETVIATLSPGTGYTIGTPNNATITITDVYFTGFPGIIDVYESMAGLTKDISYLETTIADGHLWIRVGLNTAIQMSNVSILLDTDQNPMTGDFRHGYIGGAEYRIWLSVTTGFFADYSLIKLPTSIDDCDSVLLGGKCEKTIFTSPQVTIQNNLLTIAVPLTHIGNPTAVDVFATTYEGSNANSIPGNGDRAPDYGALDTKTGRVVVRRPGKTVLCLLTDTTNDTTGLGFDLKTANFISIADQLIMSLQFSQPFDTTHPQLGKGPRGKITFDSDHQLMTGSMFMGNQIPTWGGDGLLSFDLTTLVPLFQYSFDTTV